MSEYRAIYKCHLCGEEFEDGQMERDIAYMGTAVLTVKNHFKPESCEVGIHRYNVHNCSDGSYGLADFVGFRKAEDRYDSKEHRSNHNDD